MSKTKTPELFHDGGPPLIETSSLISNHSNQTMDLRHEIVKTTIFNYIAIFETFWNNNMYID